jgi:hypothetical protein
VEDLDKQVLDVRADLAFVQAIFSEHLRYIVIDNGDLRPQATVIIAVQLVRELVAVRGQKDATILLFQLPALHCCLVVPAHLRRQLTSPLIFTTCRHLETVIPSRLSYHPCIRLICHQYAMLVRHQYVKLICHQYVKLIGSAVSLVYVSTRDQSSRARVSTA